jgi:hypothetical protein
VSPDFLVGWLLGFAKERPTQVTGGQDREKP